MLGPLEVTFDGDPVAIPAGKCRVLLATLLLRPNRFVSTHRLVERLWGETVRPERAAKNLHMTLTRLRKALGPADCVTTTTNGYLAEVGSEQLDLLRFRALAGEHPHSALELWRGPALANVSSDVLHEQDVPPLVDERLTVLERRIGIDLDRGSAGELVTELRSLVTGHPWREALWGHLMLALYRAGRQAEALGAYEEIRRRLADELGVDPGPRLRDLHRRVLRMEVSSPERQVAAPGPRADQASTLSWCRYDVLGELSDFAAAQERLDQPWQLPATVMRYLLTRGTDEDFAGLFDIALKAAELAGDRRGRAIALHTLGHTHRNMGRHEEAHALLHRALRARHEVGEHRGVAITESELAANHFRMGHLDDALRHHRSAVEQWGRAGDAGGRARSMNGLAWVLVHTGEAAEAARTADEASAALTSLGMTDPLLEDTRATAKFRTGDLDGAVRVYRDLFAGSLFGQMSRSSRVEVLLNGAAVLAAAGDRREAERIRELAAISAREPAHTTGPSATSG
ncbi:BTAD domain-containing putative transcriptional regulator [Lentzea sp. NPDC055074]